MLDELAGETWRCGCHRDLSPIGDSLRITDSSGVERGASNDAYFHEMDETDVGDAETALVRCCLDHWAELLCSHLLCARSSRFSRKIPRWAIAAKTARLRDCDGDVAPRTRKTRKSMMRTNLFLPLSSKAIARRQFGATSQKSSRGRDDPSLKCQRTSSCF